MGVEKCSCLNDKINGIPTEKDTNLKNPVVLW